MSRKLISSGSDFENIMGYSRAVVQGDMIFVSGTTGYDYSDMSISEDIAQQTEQCLKNIEAALNQADSSLKDVVRVTYIITNKEDFSKCYDVLGKYFGNVKPAATVYVAGLLDDKMKIEIQVTAVKQK
ncbi:MAG: RidA family protein [Flavobacteriales bacterium]|nr:RidA family protein [Flavobacteriales bacterium]